MRKLLGILFLVAATVLVAHGLFLDAEAAERMPAVAGTTDVPTFRKVAVQYPYCQATIEASLTHLKAAQGGLRESRYLKNEEFARTVLSLHRTFLDGVSKKPPYLTPAAASILGLVGILLVTLLPGTRFRALGFLAFLGAVFTALGASFAPEAQIVVCRDIPFYVSVMAWTPRIAQALLALTGLLFLFEKGAKPSAGADR